MKIAVLSSHTPSLFWFRTDMMQSFIARGCTVIAVGNESEDKWKEKFSEKGIRYISAAISRNGTNPFNDIKTLKSLKKILKKEKPDKIFTYQAKTVIYGGLAAKSAGIYEVYPLIAGLGSIFLSKGIKAKLLAFVLKTEYKIGMKNSEKVFFQNIDDVKFFTDNKIIPEEKAVIINGSGVNLEKFKFEPLIRPSSFLCVSRLIRDKGVYEYLEAAKKIKKDYPNARFMLVGPYDTNPSAIKKEELSPFIDEGVIEYYGEQKDVRPYLSECSVFVLPSYREGTPKTVLEAEAMGRAVITTNAPGCRETVIDGVSGFTVPIKSCEAVAEKMRYFIENPEEAEKMGKAGRRIAEEKYDVRLINKKICKVMKIEKEAQYELV